MKKLFAAVVLVAAVGCSSTQPSAEDFARVSSALKIASSAGAIASQVLATHALNEAAAGNAAGAAEIGDVAAKIAEAASIAKQAQGDVDQLGSLVTGSPAPASK